MNEREVRSFAGRDEWDAWLELNHGSSRGLWIRFAKKGSGLASVSHAEALECALCHGWIDGQTESVDEATWLQKFTPRRSRSLWSKINRAKAEELIERGLMKPAGLHEVERAKADGRWDAAYDPVRGAVVPDDLLAALSANPPAQAFFAALDSKNRYAVLHRVQTAKGRETRARRIAQFVAMLERHERLHP